MSVRDDGDLSGDSGDDENSGYTVKVQLKDLADEPNCGM